MTRTAILAAVVLGGSAIAVAAQQGKAPSFPPVNSIEKIKDNL